MPPKLLLKCVAQQPASDNKQVHGMWAGVIMRSRHAWVRCKLRQIQKECLASRHTGVHAWLPIDS